MRRGDPAHNRTFRAIVSRRAVLAGGGAAAAGFLVPGRRRARGAAAPAGFRPVPVAEGGGPNPTISPDYRYSVLIPWGEPLVPGGPAFHER